MSLPPLTIFANFKIDQEERYLRMMDSFLSFKDICAEKWVINIRGRYKNEAEAFLRGHLGHKLEVSFSASKQGWFHDSRLMLKQIESGFVMFWIEDHLNLSNVSVYPLVLQDMVDSNCDFLGYSWFHPETEKPFGYLNGTSFPTLIVYDLTKSDVLHIEKQLGGAFHLIGALSIMTTYFFSKMLCTNHPFIKRWPKEVPFDFEKISTDRIFLPLKVGLPKFELFASIDAGPTESYSLIGRGVYPDRMSRDALKQIERPSKHYGLKQVCPQFVWDFLSKGYGWIKRVRYTLNI